MRYIVINKEDASREIFIWSKSQHQIPIKQGITRECSHRDFLRNNNIPFKAVSSIGMVYYNPENGKREVSDLPWDTPAPEEDNFLVQKEVGAFCKKHPELKAEIQADWNTYMAWKKRTQELSAGRK